MTHTKSEELFRRAVEKIPGGVNSQTRINTDKHKHVYRVFMFYPRSSVYPWPYFLGVSSHDTYQIRRTVSPRGGKDSGWRELANTDKHKHVYRVFMFYPRSSVFIRGHISWG